MLNIDHAEIDIIKGDWHFIGDFFDFVCGSNIGHGETRWVYTSQFDSKMVIKIEKPKKSGFQFDNVSEWGIWSNIIQSDTDHKKYAKFLAPCVRISSCGRFLQQHKTEPITEKELPKLIPYWLADTKLQNWGRLGKNIVCHDYANHRFFSKAAANKLVKPNWF